jgi:hypothetical protein
LIPLAEGRGLIPREATAGGLPFQVARVARLAARSDEHCISPDSEKFAGIIFQFGIFIRLWA